MNYRLLWFKVVKKTFYPNVSLQEVINYEKMYWGTVTSLEKTVLS